jgi:formylmethanofuran dehydrogenase subunit E
MKGHREDEKKDADEEIVAVVEEDSCSMACRR